MAKQRITLSGNQIGHWLVVRFDRRIDGGDRLWVCQCVCGTVRSVRQSNLVKGGSRHCGCKNTELLNAYHDKIRPLRVPAKSRTPEYRSWLSMKERCYNPKAPGFKYWGGRGVTVCEAWIDSFDAFLEHVGPMPSNKNSIDRWPNNNGNYEPGNVRWADKPEQCRNRRNCHQVTFDGRSQTVAEWASEIGMPYNTLYRRIVISKWPVEIAFSIQASSGFRIKPTDSRCKFCGADRVMVGKKLICRPCDSARCITYKLSKKLRSVDL